MIEHYTDPDRALRFFVLRSDSSLSWQANKFLLAGISVIALTIAGAFMMMGLWLILPFSGLEVAALWVMMYAVKLRQRAQEVLRVSDYDIVVQRGRHLPEHELKFPRHWTRLVVRQGPTELHPKRLYLRCYGQETEVGCALGPHDRDTLIHELAATITPIFMRSPAANRTSVAADERL